MNSEKEKFEKHALEHIYYLGNTDNSLNEDIKEILNKIRKNKIKMVDIGAGDGNLAIILSKNKNVELTVTDISKTRINRIKNLTKNSLHKYLVDDVMKSKLKSNYFDFVNSDMVLEHVPSDEKMIELINKILKPKGYFRITTIFKNKLSFWIYMNKGQFVIDPTHVREYSSEDSIRKLFKKTNLKITKTKKEKLTFNPFKFILKNSTFKFNKPGYYSITIIGKKE